jgi:hypothetical protein
MIDISINKLFTMITGSSVALLSMLDLNAHRDAESDVQTEIREVIELYVRPHCGRVVGHRGKTSNTNGWAG